MNIDMRNKINIIGIGSISTLLILLMIETLFFQIISDTLINNINDNLMLLIIVVGLFIFTIIISIIVGYFVTQDISRGSVFRASIMSLECLIMFLFIVSNISLFFTYRNMYSGLTGNRSFLILPLFPQVLINFGIYILSEIFYLFILIIVVYYLFFVLFLEKLFITKY